MTTSQHELASAGLWLQLQNCFQHKSIVSLVKSGETLYMLLVFGYLLCCTWINILRRMWVNQHQSARKINKSIRKWCNLFRLGKKTSVVSFLLTVVANNCTQVIVMLPRIFILIILNLMKLIFKILHFLLGV